MPEFFQLIKSVNGWTFWLTFADGYEKKCKTFILNIAIS